MNRPRVMTLNPPIGGNATESMKRLFQLLIAHVWCNLYLLARGIARGECKVITYDRNDRTTTIAAVASRRVEKDGNRLLLRYTVREVFFPERIHNVSVNVNFEAQLAP